MNQRDEMGHSEAKANPAPTPGGSVLDFAAWLTTRDKVITVGATEPVYDMIEALEEYANPATSTHKPTVQLQPVRVSEPLPPDPVPASDREDALRYGWDYGKVSNSESEIIAKLGMELQAQAGPPTTPKIIQLQEELEHSQALYADLSTAYERMADKYDEARTALQESREAGDAQREKVAKLTEELKETKEKLAHANRDNYELQAKATNAMTTANFQADCAGGYYRRMKDLEAQLEKAQDVANDFEEALKQIRSTRVAAVLGGPYTYEDAMRHIQMSVTKVEGLFRSG